ncbi:MAG: DUF58 domain-containing protein [Pirellulaceae bacterium]
MTRDTGYRYLDPAALARVKNLSMVARGVVEGFISGLHSSPYKGFSVEFAEHREYTRGDNLRFLDWRMLARTDRLYVKQYEEETNLKAQIILDTSGSMLYRHGKALSKLEYSAYLTAILAFLMTRQQDAVGLTTFDEQVQFDMPARTSPRHFGEMMRQLEGLCDRLKQHEGETTPAAGTNVGDTLHRLAERFKRRCLIILISDLYDDPDAVMRALHHFRHRRHEVILFHVFDQTEIDFPFKETMRLVDMETGERLQIDPSYVREDYKRQIEEFIEFYRRSCADCQIDYVNTHTSVPYDLMLSRYLHKRGNV